jgi:hypothetical protein
MRHVPFLLLFTFGCNAVEASDVEAAGAELQARPAYRDVEEVIDNETDQNRWFDLKRRLKQDFDDVCGDTFCEGDFTNLESLSFRCSVSTRTGQLKSCLWLFAGSYETVTASTGNVRPVARFFPCRVAVPATPVELMDALLDPVESPLRRPLPGTSATLYDTLIGCL